MGPLIPAAEFVEVPKPGVCQAFWARFATLLLTNNDHPNTPSFELQPHLDKIARLGGAVLIAIRHDPNCTHCCTVTRGYFLPRAMDPFRSALVKARKKRQLTFSPSEAIKISTAPS